MEYKVGEVVVYPHHGAAIKAITRGLVFVVEGEVIEIDVVVDIGGNGLIID